MRGSWDDLRYVLAVAEHGSVASAGRYLGVNHATVLRHVNAFEKRYEVRLFERLATGYALTSEGKELVVSLRFVADNITEIERKISGLERRPEGRLRVTTTDSILAAVVAPHLAEFKEQYPRIVVDISMTVGRLDLSRREADVAIRPSSAPPENIVGIEVVPLAFGAYASATYLDGHQDRSLDKHRWLALDDLLSHAPPAQWLNSRVPAERIVLRAD